MSLTEIWVEIVEPGGVEAEIVGQLFINKFGPVGINLLGKYHMRFRPLISIKKSTYSNYEVADSGR